MVSIITVSYNAERLLPDFLDSIRRLNYPKSEYETIVVDNGSTDGSVKLVKENYPEVRVLEAGENLGFGRGNNYGMKRARGSLYFLVNNDTALTPNSLKNSVRSFEKWSKKGKIGAVNSKMVLVDKYLSLEVEGANFSGYKMNKKAQPTNANPYVIHLHRIRGYVEKIYIPITYHSVGPVRVTLSFKTIGDREFKYKMANEPARKVKFLGRRKTKNVTMVYDNKYLQDNTVDLIQNAGNVFFRDGYTRDRGASIVWHRQYYEEDVGQYEKEEFIHGFCGAGVLLNKKALDDVGYFDEDFFFYYEDGDLSLRMKKNGWEILYSPKSVIRHIHAASSKEWSSFFVFNSEKNRLLMVAKHWPIKTLLRQWGKYFFKDTFATPLYFLLNGRKKDGYERFFTRIKVNANLLFPVLKSLFSRGRLTKSDLKKFF